MNLLERLKERIKDRKRTIDASSYPGWSGTPRRAFPPVKEKAVRNAEESLGFPLPRLLRDLYLEVGNGGFGPGYGIIGLKKGLVTDEGHSVVDRYHLDREGDPLCPRWIWPEKLIVICNWGCAMYSCLDCSRLEAPVIRFDPNGLDSERCEGWHDAFWIESGSFDIWLTSWLDGTLPFALTDRADYLWEERE